MSADGGWKVTLRCTRAEAEALPFADDAFADLDQQPTLIADEPDPAQPDDWRLHAYFAVEPEPDWLARLTNMCATRSDIPVIERLPDSDWVTLSQAGLEPVSAGRFHVATRAHAHQRRAGQLQLVIEAGLAFGTGQHATTHGCLAALDRLARAHSFRRFLDLGTGTGVLAMAAAKRWPRAQVVATDIDPASVAVTRRNTHDNGLRLGRGAGRIEVFTAAGMLDARFKRRGPYDLIAANILAAPLIALARPISAALAPGGFVVLAGLLDSQATRVAAAYAARGLNRIATSGGEWPTLIMQRSARLR